MDIKQKIETFDTTFIDKAVKLNIESGFYSEPQTKLSTHPFFPYFRKKIKQLFQNTYKENAFIETYMGENVPTLEIVETIFNRLKNIWDSQNSNLIIAGTNKNKDIVSFLSEYLKWFRTTGWEALKNEVWDEFVSELTPEERERFHIDKMGNLDNPYQVPWIFLSHSPIYLW